LTASRLRYLNREMRSQGATTQRANLVLAENHSPAISRLNPPFRLAAVSVVTLTLFGCSRTIQSDLTKDAGSGPSIASAAAARALTEAEALARVEALPEYRGLASEEFGDGVNRRKKAPLARVAKAPRFESSDTGEANYWGIQVADRSYFAADGGTNLGQPPDMDLRVEAFTGSVSVLSDDGRTYRDYSSWSALRRNVSRATALAMSIPEWEAEAAVVRKSPAGRSKGAVLGLVFGPEPPVGCQPGTPDCRYGFTAISICSGCAGGRWVDFEIDLSNETLFVNDIDFPDFLNYGKWRDYFRAKMRKQSPWEYVTLLAANRAFPALKAGHGPFGYGAPVSVSRAKAPSAVLTALEQGGHQFLRTERYAGGFPLYVVRSVKDGVSRPSNLRVWGKALVVASGARACEVTSEAGDARYQFDPNVLHGDSGGVYVFLGGDFHPWLAHD